MVMDHNDEDVEHIRQRDPELYEPTEGGGGVRVELVFRDSAFPRGEGGLCACAWPVA